MSRKDQRLYMVLAVCLALSVLSWGLSVYKKARFSIIMSQIEEEPVVKDSSKSKPAVNRMLQRAIDPVDREAEAEEASGIKEEDISLLIAKLADPDTEQSMKAADKLAELGSPAVNSLIEQLQNASVELKGQIIFLLGRIKDKEAVTALTAYLNDDNAYLRRNAAEALGKIKDPACVYELTWILNDAEPDVREASSWALGELKDNRATSEIMKIFSAEKEESVKTSMVQALAKIKSETSAGKLAEELNSRSDLLYKNEVVQALGEIGDSRVLAQLQAYRESLGQEKPEEKILIFGWEEAVRVTEDAISKLKGGLS